jgi:hypothetical protein
MSSDELQYTHKGVLHIGEENMACFVLEDGKRVISGRSLTKAIGMKGRGQGVSRIPSHSTLKPFVSKDLETALMNPIEFNAGRGYEATILLKVCEAVLNARDAGVLRTEQELRYARACDILIRAFATVGIIALVDEATGYQVDRDKEELQKILSAYISPELMPWTRRFEPDFYENLFRLRGWQYRPISVKKPLYVGKLTNQLVYEKLPPGVLDELRRINPTNENGRRKHKHHQFLTNDIGNTHLEKHLAIVTTLMRISPNWRVFMSHFYRAFPDAYTQGEFEFPEDDETT